MNESSEKLNKNKERNKIQGRPFVESKVAEIKIYSNEKFGKQSLDAMFFLKSLERNFNEIYFIYQHYKSDEPEYRQLKKTFAENIFVKLRLIEGTMKRLSIAPIVSSGINKKVIDLRDAIAHENERLEYFLLYKDRSHSTIASHDPDQNRVFPILYQGEDLQVNSAGSIDWTVRGDNYNMTIQPGTDGKVYLLSPLGIFENRFVYMDQYGRIDWISLDDALIGYYFKIISEFLNQYRVPVIESGPFKGWEVDRFNALTDDQRKLFAQVMEEKKNRK